MAAVSLAIGLGWLCYLLLFSTAEMPSLPVRNELGQPWLRVQLWLATLDLDLLITGWTGGDWQNVGFGSRLVVGCAALLLLALAYGPGVLLLDVLTPPAKLLRGERGAFALALGLHVHSLWMLALGLAGGLSLGWLALGPAAIGWGWIGYRRFALGKSALRERIVEQSLGHSRFAGLALFTMLPFVLVIILGAMLPPHEFDVREYHLQVPKEWYQQGTIGFLPHNVYGNMPLGAEMHPLMAMCLWPGEDSWWWGALVGKTVMACFVPLTAGALFAAGRRWLSPLAGAVAALLYVSTPWIAGTAMQGLNEPAVACYGLLAVYAASLAMKREVDPIRGWLLSGFMAGAAVSCKYPALLFFGVPLGLTLIVWEAWPPCRRTLRWPTNRRSTSNPGESYTNDSSISNEPSSDFSEGEPPTAADPNSRPRSVRRHFRFAPAIAFGLALTLSCGLWFGKNAVLTGNPTYPLLYEWFGGATRTDAKNLQWQAAHGGGMHVSAASAVAVVKQIVWSSEWLSPLLIPLAMIGVTVGWRNRATRLQVALLAGILLFGLLAWYGVTHRIDRFLVPLLPLLCLLGGIGACWSDSPAWRWVLSCIVAIGLLLNFVTMSSFAVGDPRILVDLESLRLNDPLRVDPVHAWLNEHAPPGSKVLLVGDAEPFDLRIPAVYNTVFDDNRFEQIMRGKSADQRREALRELGITHIYFHWGHIARYRSPGNYGFTDYVTRDLVEKELVQQQQLLVEVPEFPGALYRVNGT